MLFIEKTCDNQLCKLMGKCQLPIYWQQYKGTRCKSTGFFIAHIDKNEEECIIYYGFA